MDIKLSDYGLHEDATLAGTSARAYLAEHGKFPRLSRLMKSNGDIIDVDRSNGSDISGYRHSVSLFAEDATIVYIASEQPVPVAMTYDDSSSNIPSNPSWTGEITMRPHFHLFARNPRFSQMVKSSDSFAHLIKYGFTHQARFSAVDADQLRVGFCDYSDQVFETENGFEVRCCLTYAPTEYPMIGGTYDRFWES